jgi:hypothetical protein
MRCIIRLFFVFTNCFASVKEDTIPRFAFKFNPVALVLELDQHFQFSGEYFLSPQRSLQATYGFGNHKILQNSNNNKTLMLRLEHRKYFGAFTSKKKGRGYLGQEIMYKNALEQKIAHKIEDVQAPGVNYQLNVNVAAFHLKLGHEFIGKAGFPVFDVFIGLGGRTYKNSNQNLPKGYEFSTPTMYKRLDRSVTSLSAVFGAAFGFGGRR